MTTDGVAGDQVFQKPCDVDILGTDPNEAQWWYTGLNANTLPYTGYPIQSVASGLYLDVSGNYSLPGAAIDTWYWNGGANQYFETFPF